MLCASASLTVAACRAPTQITLELSTDLPCVGSGNLSGTAIRIATLGPNLDDVAPVTTTLACDAHTGRIGSLVVIPSGSRNDEIAIEILASVGGHSLADCLVKPKGGCIVARRALSFVEHQSLRLPIAMRAVCIDVLCEPTDTCVGGACVSAKIPDLGACFGDGCDEHVLLPSGGSDAGVDVRDAFDSGDATLGDTEVRDASGDADVLEVDVTPTDTALGGAGTWVAMAPSASIGVTARAFFSAVWTGTELLAWGGQSPIGDRGDGASYDPKSDAWSALPAAGLGVRQAHGAVWTGTKMIVWGGATGGGATSYTDGAIFDATLRTWKKIGAAPPIGGRTTFGAVWSTTTGEMLVWGGSNSTGIQQVDGAAYDPVADKWRLLAASPLEARSEVAAVWTGKEMVIYGGGGCAAAVCADAAAYNPKSDTWRMLPGLPITTGRMYSTANAVSDGSSAAFFGGGYEAGGLAYGDGVLFDGASTWTDIPTPGASILATPARTEMLGWWAAGRLYVFGGRTTTGALPASGAGYDPVTRSWIAMTSPPGTFAGRLGARVVWTGTEALIYGGLDDAIRFRP